MYYTEEEGADALRDMMALLRAKHENDGEGADAILAGAGEHGLRVLADTLTTAFCGMLAQRTLAIGMLSEEQRAEVDAADLADLLRDPQMRTAIAKSLAIYQAGVLGDGAD